MYNQCSEPQLDISQVFINVIDANHMGYYDDMSNTIQLNMQKDNEDKSKNGRGQAYYHEVGHMVDDYIDCFGSASNDWTYDFYDALKKDFDNIIRRMNITKEKMDSDSEEKNFTVFTKEIVDKGEEYFGVQDLVYGFGHILGYQPNKGEYQYTHENVDYNEEMLSNEAFAHFFEAGMDYKEDKLNRIKEYFPNAYKVYQKMLEDAIN